MRKPMAFGFYPFDRDELDKLVTRLLTSNEMYDAKGVIVPHAGYQYSGSIAGQTFASANTDKNRFVLIGPNHSGCGNTVSASAQNWWTPIGIVFSDNKLEISVDEKAHEQEHSIEVQIPFIIKKYGSATKQLKINPIILRDMPFEEIEELANKVPEDAFYVCSSDFIHFGPNYGYEPVNENVVEWVKEQDSKLLGYIENLDAIGFYEMVKEQGLTVCGYNAVTLMLIIMKKMNVRAKTIAYGTSLKNSDDSFVSYAGVVFY